VYGDDGKGNAVHHVKREGKCLEEIPGGFVQGEMSGSHGSNSSSCQRCCEDD